MTQHDLKLSADLQSTLRCPGRPDLPLTLEGDVLVARDGADTFRFPVIDGTPVLINEETSVFRHDEFQPGGGVTTMDLRGDEARLNTPLKRFKNFLGKLTPKKSRAVSDFTTGDAIAAVLQERPDAKILVIGAGDARFTVGEEARIVYTDVALAPDTHLIADSHDLPFQDDVFDLAIAVAVLQHVADPYRCVAELQRVLAPGGYVYAVTPFMQDVCMGRYDFTRFTSLGHRRLFRWFDDVRSGVANGPGMVVAWALEYYFSSFSESPRLRSLIKTVTRFIGWPFLLFDKMLARKRGSRDCASAFYFFGRLRADPVSDREIVDSYQGLN